MLLFCQLNTLNFTLKKVRAVVYKHHQTQKSSNLGKVEQPRPKVGVVFSPQKFSGEAGGFFSIS